MRKLILVALLAAAPLLGSTPAAAFGCGWFGYSHSSAAYAPRAYSYAPTAATIVPVWRVPTMVGPSIAPARVWSPAVRLGVGVGDGEHLSLVF